MDFRQQLASYYQHLRTFPWNGQTVAILCLLVLAFFAVVVIQRPAVSDDQDDLFSSRRLAPRELQQIEAALGKADLTEYEINNGAIFVPRKLRARYFAALQDANSLPRTFHSPTIQALKATSAFETSRTSQQRMHHAREQEARIAICQMSGIEDAFVIFDEKTDRSLHQQRVVTASVGVRTNPDHPLDPQAIKVIQDMLLGFKVDLKREGITVTDLNNRLAIRGSLDQAGSAEIRALAEKTLERTWKGKIQDALSFVPEATVSVRVVPDTSPTEARSVHASIGIPSTYLTRQGLRIDSRQYEAVVARTQTKIQQALKPILPDTGEAFDELVAVNVFDIVDTPKMSRPTRLFANVFTCLLVIACLLSGVFLFVAVGKPRDPEPEHQLRVYEADDEMPSNNEDESEPTEPPEDQVAKLRAFVADDMDAAAQKLSDFIDRAS